MNITSAKYHKSPTGEDNMVIETSIDGKITSVPLDPANSHYAEIQRQVAAGTLTIADAD